MAEEIECAERTLLKRRAELREADRLLTEAQVELQSTRGKVREGETLRAEGLQCWFVCLGSLFSRG